MLPFFVVCFFVSTLAQASVKLNYVSEGKILNAYDSTIQNIPTPNIEVTDQVWSDAQAPFLVATVNLNTLQMVVTETHNYVNEFSTQKFLVDCQTSFTIAEQIQAMPYQRSFESMLDNNPPAHDFSTFKAVVFGLIDASILTEAHYEKMRTACALQNIDLDNF